MSLLLALTLAQAMPSAALPSAPGVEPAQEDIVVTARRMNWFKARVLKNRVEDPWRCEILNSSGIDRLDQRMCQGMITCATEMEPRFYSPEAMAAAGQNEASKQRYFREYRRAIQPCYKRERRATMAEMRAERQARRQAGT